MSTLFRLFSLTAGTLIIVLPSLAASSILPGAEAHLSPPATKTEPSLTIDNNELSSELPPLFPGNYYGIRTDLDPAKDTRSFYESATQTVMNCKGLCEYHSKKTSRECPLMCPGYLAAAVFPEFLVKLNSESLFPVQFFVAMSVYNSNVDYNMTDWEKYYNTPEASYNTEVFIDNVEHLIATGFTDADADLDSYVAVPSLIRNLLNVPEDYPPLNITNLPYPKKSEVHKKSDIEKYKAFKQAFIQNNDIKKQSCMQDGKTPEACRQPIISIHVDDIYFENIDLILQSGLEMFLPPEHQGDENCKKTTRANIWESGYHSDFRKYFRDYFYKSNPSYYNKLFRISDIYEAIFGVDYNDIIPVKMACRLLKASEAGVDNHSDAPSSSETTSLETASGSGPGWAGALEDRNSGEQRTAMYVMVAFSVILANFMR